MNEPKEEKIPSSEYCNHNWVETEYDDEGQILEIHYKCNQCGTRRVEKYLFYEGYELSKKGTERFKNL